MASAEQAAVAAALKMLQPVEAEEATPPSSESEVAEEIEAEVTDEAETTEEDAPLFPELEVQPPEELLEELAEEDEEELVAVVEEDEDDEYEREDDPVAKAKIAKLEKQLAHERKLRAKEKTPEWKEEARKFFPLSESVLNEIKADSRRSFLRQAKEAHDTLLPFAKRFADAATRAVEVEREKAAEAARKAAVEAWGQVPPSEPTEEAKTVTPDDALARARQRGDLTGAIKAMMGGAR